MRDLRQAIFDAEVGVERHRSGETADSRRDRRFEHAGEAERVLGLGEHDMVFNARDFFAFKFACDDGAVLGDEPDLQRDRERLFDWLARRGRRALRDCEVISLSRSIVAATH